MSEPVWKCEFCRRAEGEDAICYHAGNPRNGYYLTYVKVFKDHFEQDFEIPRFTNICESCHTTFHRLLKHRSKIEAEKYIRRRHERYPVT
jgi:hypothetical protein